MQNIMQFEGLKYNEILKFNRESQSNAERFKSLKVAFLRNITVDNIINCLKFLCYKNEINLSVYQSEYDQFLQETYLIDNDLYKFNPSIIIISINLRAYIDMRLSELKDYSEDIIRYIDETVGNIRKNTDSVIMIDNFEYIPYENYGIYDYQRSDSNFYEISRLNMKICEIASKYYGVYIVNKNIIQMRIGVINYFDNRMFNLTLSPYTIEGAKSISIEYMKYINAFIGKTKKCIIIDCDNTLWGGIIGEDGLEGIKIDKTGEGKGFFELQKVIYNLYKRGIILSICTKNNKNDVMDVLNTHPEMLLRENHFALIKSDWNDKVKNIKEIIRTLNITYDSVVFIDDSPFEVEMVNKLLPGVTTILLDIDPSGFAELIESSGQFDNPVFSQEDRIRTEMYKSEIQRRMLKESFGDDNINAYLNDLGIEIIADYAKDSVYQRLSQLTQRTNQFNLTTKRYTIRDIEHFNCRKDYLVRFYRYKDKFGDAGIIGLVILKIEQSDFIIDSFMISCRVLGRGVEDAIMYDIVNLARERTIERIYGEYIKTSKNEQVKDFYEKKSFEIVELNEAYGKYLLNEKKFNDKIILPKHIKLSL